MLLILFFTSIQVLLFCREADATITWTAPPPQRGPLQTSDSSVRRTTQPLEINSPEGRLKWEFTLSGETLDRVTWAKGIVPIGRKTSSGTIFIEPTENFREHFGISASDPATLIIKNVTKVDAAVFRCSVETDAKTWADEIQVVIVVPAKLLNNVSGNQSVSESSDLQLYCGASGNPAPNITWIRVFTNGSESQVLHRIPTWNITNISRTDAGTYRCTASNGVGDAVSHTLTVNVLYRPKIVNLPSVYNVSVQQSVTLQCEAEGNPTPSFAWTPCKDRCDESTLVIPEVFNDTVYTCTVNNSLGSDFRTASIVIAGKEINVTMTITGESCTNKQLNKTLLSNKLTKEIDKAFVNKSVYNSTTLKDVRCGSLIVDLTLKFNSIVSETWVLSILKEATKDGKLGEFNVAASSIKGTRPVISTTTAPPNGKTTLRSSDGPNIGLIVGCAVGGFIALVIIIAVVIWCVRKNSNKDKDKKRKSKTSNKEAAVTAFTSTPSQPSTAIETRDITLVWDYTLDGTVLKATFSNVTGGINEEIARKVQGGSTVVKNNYKDRFRAGVSDNHAWLKILRVQMSDQGEYQFSLNASGSGTITNVVKVVVQSAANSITWYEPPPVQTTTDTKLIQTHNIQLLGGSTNVKLSWNFTLGRNLNVDVLQIFLRRDVVASIFPPGQPTVLDAFSDRFSISWINSQKVTLVIFRVTAFNNGEFSCKVTTGRGRKVWTRKIKVNVVDPPTVITQQCSTPINEGDSVTLYCNATGNPAPNITWIRTNTEEVLSNKKAYIITAIKRNESGSYKCLAWNGIGKNSTKSCTVDVQYHPKIMLSADYNVAVHQSVTLHCRAEGNPQPTFLWSPCDPQENVCDESTLIISQVLNDGVYTCTITNILGSDSANTSVVIAGTEINVTLVITSESCIVGKWYKSLMLSKNLNEAISLIFVNESAYRRTIVMDVRCGSFIVDLVLKFSSTVTEKRVLNMLRRAIKNGKLGEFSINTSSIIGTRVFVQRTTMPSISSKTTPSLSNDEVCGHRGCSCNCNVLIVLVSILAAIIILLIVFIIWLLKKGTTGRGRSYAESAGNNNNAIEMEVRQPDRIPSWPQTTEVPSRSQYMVLDDARRSNDLPEVTSRTDTSQTSQYAPLHPSTMSREIPRENVTIEKIIGKGAFSQVAKGRVIGLRERAQMTLVAVKMLKANAPVSDKKDLLSELEVMKTLKPHPHVIKLLGCVTESEPLLVLIEYVPYGDLLGYLRKSRGLNDTYYQDPDIKPQTSLTSQQLMKFSWQIADGMSYLSSRSIIHRDLAARNVLVGEKETCKVTDFGMARDVRQENIYERKTKGRLPVKWTAYESLMYGTYTTKSDVWSYGVLLYEICTIGGSPYPRMDMANIASLLHQGYRMPKPQHVDEELYKIMTTCWEENPDVRPTFAELRNKLKKMENRHKRLINMKMYDTQLYANVEDLVM